MADDAMLPAGSFDKADPGNDLAFYAPTRLVTHIDEVAVAALTDVYRALLPDDGRVLDLMSSWVSHLPDDRRYGEVVGHGMNADELAANPRLDRWFVQDLNARRRCRWTMALSTPLSAASGCSTFSGRSRCSMRRLRVSSVCCRAND